MKKLSILLCLLLTVLIAGEAWAKRTDPKPVTPVVHKGVKYVASLESGREGKIEAQDEKSGKKLWDAVIYTVKIDPDLEEDVQWVFITTLEIKDNKLLVTNEKNEKYAVDLKTKKVEKVKKVAAEEPKEKRELLANHETLAVFDGLEYHLCRGRTALCPDRCGDSGEFATFAVKKYLKYEKHGEYGDPQQTSFPVQVSDYDKKPKGDPKILETVKGLKKGDFVLLSWHHDYVTKEGASSPERPIMKLEKIASDKAKELLSATAE